MDYKIIHLIKDINTQGGFYMYVKSQYIMGDDGKPIGKRYRSNADAQAALNEMIKREEPQHMDNAIVKSDDDHSDDATMERPSYLNLIKPAIPEAAEYKPDETMNNEDEELPEDEDIEKISDEIITEVDEEMPNVAPRLIVKYEVVSTDEYLKMCNVLDFSMACQRSFVWDKEHKDLLIDSKLSGYDCGVIIIWQDKVVDGKQRSNDMLMTYRGQYTTETLESDYEELNGKLFGAWPTEYMNAFLESPIHIMRLPDEWDEDQVVEQFMRTNNGRPLTEGQRNKGKTRPIAFSLSKSISHKLWDFQTENSKKEVVSVYGKLKTDGKEKIFFNLLHLLYCNPDEQDFKEKNLYKWLIKWGDSAQSHIWRDCEMRSNKLYAIFSHLTKQGDDGKKAMKFYCKKLHMLSLLAAVDDKTDITQAADNMLKFYQLPSDKADRLAYKNLCTEGTNDTAAIQKRFAFIRKMIHE